MEKGKWIVNLDWGHKFDDLFSSFDYITHLIGTEMNKKMNMLECYTISNNKVITLDDQYTRTAQYWNKDVSEK